MEYKGIKILAVGKSYSQWTLDSDGKLDDCHYDYDGVDVVSYTCNKYPHLEAGTIDELKMLIDKEVK